jgi:hypothetical protein
LLPYSSESVVLLTTIKKLTIQSCNFPFVLYGCKTWPVTLREEHRLSVFENRVVRRVLLPAVMKSQAEENCIMRSSIIYTPPDIRMISSRRLRWTGHMAHGGVENTCLILVETLETRCR